MCRWLQVSTAGFYDHLNTVQTARARRRALVTIHVRAAFTLGRGTYGVRRVHRILTRSDDPQVASVSPKLVRSIMAELEGYGDNAYGSGEFQDRLAEAGIESKCKTQRPTAAGGLFTKDAFDVDLDTGTVTCPNKKTAPIRRNKDGSGAAQFGPAARCGRGVPSRRRAQHQGRPARASAGSGRATRTGSSTTGPPGRRWSARSRI